MALRCSAAELAACGTVTTEELAPLERGRFRFPRRRYVWRPSGLLAGQLPGDFQLAVLAHSDASGVRRFCDADGARVHLLYGFLAGVALLNHVQGWTRTKRNEYRAPYFIYEYVQQTHAHLGCHLDSRQQLTIRPGSRSAPDEEDVLPADLGLDDRGRGTRWNVEQLLIEGTLAAEAQGLADVEEDAVISLGLYAAARMNPLRRTAKQAERDVRRALFDTDALIARPGRRLTAIIQDRVYRLLDAHLDESREDFNRWFYPSGGRNIPRAIGRQPNRVGGIIPNEDVMGVLLHLAWKEYGRLSQCLGAFGQAFAAALPEPLSRKERELFNLSLMPHRYFGGLARWLLMERIDLLQPAFVDLFANPRDRVALGALYRLLSWYPEMVRKRREADRLKHRRRRQQGDGDNQERLERELDADGELPRTDRRRRGPGRRSHDDERSEYVKAARWPATDCNSVNITIACFVALSTVSISSSPRNSISSRSRTASSDSVYSQRGSVTTGTMHPLFISTQFGRRFFFPCGVRTRRSYASATDRSAVSSAVPKARKIARAFEARVFSIPSIARKSAHTPRATCLRASNKI